MRARYFYLKWDDLLDNLVNAYKIAYSQGDIMEDIITTLPEEDFDVLLNLKRESFFLPIPLEGYDWIEVVQVPMDLTLYHRILELDDNVLVNKNNLSKEDNEALEFIEDLTFGRWGPLSDIFIENVFKDFDKELYDFTKRVFGSKTLSPNMIDSVLKKWEEHSFIEKMEVFGKEGHHERRIMLLWIDLLKAVKRKGNWGLLYNWY